MQPLKTEKSRRRLVDDSLDADQRCARATKSALLFGFLEPATGLEPVTC